MMFTVIICTKDRPEELAITLRSLFAQSVLPDRLVIVDDGNADKTRKVIYGLQNPGVDIIRVTPRPKSTGLTAARNIGIQHAAPGIILFLDDDVTLHELYIETIRQFVDDNPDVDGVTGWINTAYHNESLIMRFLRVCAGLIQPSTVPASMFYPTVIQNGINLYPIFRMPGALTIPAEWLSGCNMAYRSSVFDEGYEFPEDMEGYALGEDRVFSHQLYQDGKQLRLVYDASLNHRSRP